MDQKSEFRNASQGHVGVITLEPGGKEKAIAVRPGHSVWLTEDEQILTANAPRQDEDNPFLNGDLELVTAPKDVRNRRPIGHTDAEQPNEASARSKAEAAKAKAAADAEQRAAEEAERSKKAQEQAGQGASPPVRRQSPDETGAARQPQGSSAKGTRAAGEEVGTPAAGESKPSE
jgi:hypothetical protein